MRESIQEELLRLSAADANPHKRGIELQGLVGRVFRQAHYTVSLNPAAARPRQTDLIARSQDDMFLIETKWRKRAADVGDVASLQDRLSRTQSGVIGVLIAIAGFSTNAVREVETTRNKPVLLISGHELEDVIFGGTDLRQMLKSKKDALLVRGAALVLPAGGGPPASKPVAKSGVRFISVEDEIQPWISCYGGFGEFTFTQSLFDIDWVAATGAGVSVDLPLELSDSSDLARVITELGEMGWATPTPHWSIQQSTRNWHGVGGEAAGDALDAWEQRYLDAESLHHSELLVYQDACHGGFYTLTATISAKGRRQVRNAGISVQLVGVPLDREPLLRLCEAFQVHPLPSIRPRVEKSVTTIRLWRDDRVPIQLVAYCVERDVEDHQDPEWVSGIVVRNPFFDLGQGQRPPDWLPPGISESEMLICDLRSWHPLREPPSAYELAGCEWAWTSDASVIRFTADWRD